MDRIRKLLFFSLLAGYLAICPIILLYTLGVVIRPAEEESIVKTGILFVASAPPAATIFLNDRQNAKDTPAAIVDLAPGEYRLRLQRDGYREWSHTLTVNPSDVTLADDILMIPEKWDSVPASTDAFSGLTSLSGSPHLLLRKSSRFEELYLYDIQENSIVPVLDEGSPLRGGTIRSLVTVPGSPAFLVEAMKSGVRSATMVSFVWPKAVLKDVTSLVQASYDRIEWPANNPDDLFVQRGGRIDWIHVSTAAVHAAVAQNVLGFGVSGKNLYVLDEAQILSKVDFTDGSRDPIRSFEGMPVGFLPNRPVRIIPVGNGIFLLHGGNGTFSAALPDTRATIGGVRNFTIDWGSGTVLLWQAGRLGLLALYERPASKTASEKEPVLSPEWIWTGGSDIRQAFFVHQASHVLFQDRNHAILLGADFGDGDRTVTEIATLRPGTSIHYADREGRLIRLEESRGRVVWTEIVPRTRLVRDLLQDIGDRYGF